MSDSLAYKFPGMDPWLETRGMWPCVHDSLIIDVAREITSQVVPKYVALPGQRMVTVKLESFEAKETFVQIRCVEGDRRLVAVLEVLSHSNKRSGTDSRAKYLQKQEELLASDIHLVEVDLLRAGEPTVAVPPAYLAGLPPYSYLVSTRRAGVRDRADLHPIPLRHRLPRIAIPLLAPDPDAVIDLQALIERGYSAGAFALAVDYEADPDPPLSPEDEAWARGVLRAAPAGTAE